MDAVNGSMSERSWFAQAHGVVPSPDRKTGYISIGGASKIVIFYMTSLKDFWR
jgi:hypothetical protein